MSCNNIKVNCIAIRLHTVYLRAGSYIQRVLMYELLLPFMLHGSIEESAKFLLEGSNSPVWCSNESCSSLYGFLILGGDSKVSWKTITSISLIMYRWNYCFQFLIIYENFLLILLFFSSSHHHHVTWTSIVVSSFSSWVGRLSRIKQVESQRE